MVKRLYKKIRVFVKVVGESKRPGRYFIAHVLAKTGLCKFFTIKMNGYKLHFTPSALSITLFSNPGDRDHDEQFFRHVLKEGDVYIDVGANIGTLALCASGIVGNIGKVIAIEAHPVTFDYLSKNIKLNAFTNVSLLNYAVGDKEGTLSFSDINSDDQNKVITTKDGGITVPVKKLDQLLHDEKRIKLIKIDVEGFEKFVLEGACDLLQRTNIVFFESWDQSFKGYGYTTGEVISLLESMQFRVYKMIGLQKHLIDSSHHSLTCENLLAIKKGHDIG